ncbi:MAG: preprotein translocase subunit SecG [Rhodocyclaceae bacterium]|jgi:preprotein translocase subunit SecG
MDGILFPLVLTLHILVGAAVIGLVLLQHGKGADMGAAFGSGASGSLFGATGSANFLSRATGVLATVFFLTSLGLSYMATNRTQGPASVMEQVVPTPAVPTQTAPAQPESGGDSKAKEIPK